MRVEVGGKLEERELSLGAVYKWRPCFWENNETINDTEWSPLRWKPYFQGTALMAEFGKMCAAKKLRKFSAGKVWKTLKKTISGPFAT